MQKKTFNNDFCFQYHVEGKHATLVLRDFHKKMDYENLGKSFRFQGKLVVDTSSPLNKVSVFQSNIDLFGKRGKERKRELAPTQAPG